MKELKGANMDIALNNAEWEQDKCQWAEEDGKEHKCAIKNTEICKHFKGIKEPDTVLCSYPKK